MTNRMRFRKRLFAHGGSKSVDLPAHFVKQLQSDHVYLEIKDDCLIIRPEDEFTQLEKDPLFNHFIESLLADAIKHPSKLKDAKEVWDAEWDELLEGVNDDED